MPTANPQATPEPTRSTRARYAHAALVILICAAVEIALLRAAGAGLDRYWELGPVPADTQVLVWLRQGYSRAVHEIMEQVSALGSKTVLTLVVVVAVAATVLNHLYHVSVMMVLSSAGAALLNAAVKDMVERPRPNQVVEPLDPWVSDSFSFPSGHAMSSMAIYLTLGILLAHVAPNRAVARFTVLTAAALALAIGFSRMYLGVHYPTDVLAGWLAGLFWALACFGVLRMTDPSGRWVAEKT
jgi:undecaprenyl-diphosphatase